MMRSSSCLCASSVCCCAWPRPSRSSGSSAGWRPVEASDFPMVACAPRSLTLSSSACAADWCRAQAQKPYPWESRWFCRTCSLGAARAGQDASAAERTAQVDAVKAMCVRCHQPCDRMLHNRWCVSCYNRQRELTLGVNGRGTFPALTAERYPIHQVQIRFRPTDAPRWQWNDPVDRVATALEAMLCLLRRQATPLYFARPVAATVSAQAHFWGGV